jgi:hypothetical protein
VGLTVTSFYHMKSLNNWKFSNIHHHLLSLWTPAPKVACQALRCFLPLMTAGLFMIPCILQRDWVFISKHIPKVMVIYPSALPLTMRCDSLIPLVLLYIPLYIRTLPIPDRLDKFTDCSIHEH